MDELRLSKTRRNDTNISNKQKKINGINGIGTHSNPSHPSRRRSRCCRHTATVLECSDGCHSGNLPEDHRSRPLFVAVKEGKIIITTQCELDTTDRGNRMAIMLKKGAHRSLLHRCCQCSCSCRRSAPTEGRSGSLSCRRTQCPCHTCNLDPLDEAAANEGEKSRQDVSEWKATTCLLPCGCCDLLFNLLFNWTVLSWSSHGPQSFFWGLIKN